MKDPDPRIAAGVASVLKALNACDLPEGVRVWIETGDGPVDKSPSFESILKRQLPFIKAAAPEERYVLGVVLEPLKEMGQLDSQKDMYSAEEVRHACYKFMEDFMDIGLQHEDIINGRVKILENWITREDAVIGGQSVAKGTWLFGVRVIDDQLWDDIKLGNITGFSIGGWANREPVR